MINLSITPDYDRDPWLDLGDVLAEEPAAVKRVALMRNGTASGKAVVFFDVQLPDGSHVIAQTTWALLRTCYAGLAATPIVADEVIDP